MRLENACARKRDASCGETGSAGVAPLTSAIRSEDVDGPGAGFNTCRSMLPGLVAAWCAGYALRSYFYGVKPLDPATLLGTGFVLLAIAAAAAVRTKMGKPGLLLMRCIMVVLVPWMQSAFLWNSL